MPRRHREQRSARDDLRDVREVLPGRCRRRRVRDVHRLPHGVAARLDAVLMSHRRLRVPDRLHAENPRRADFHILMRPPRVPAPAHPRGRQRVLRRVLSALGGRLPRVHRVLRRRRIRVPGSYRRPARLVLRRRLIIGRTHVPHFYGREPAVASAGVVFNRALRHRLHVARPDGFC